MKPTAERILGTHGGISSKDYSSTKALLQYDSYFSPTHLFCLFIPQQREKQHRNFHAPSASRSGPRQLRGGVRRQGIPWWVSSATQLPQDVSSSERHYFRTSYTGHFLWYISWELLSINGQWIRDVVQYISAYSLLFLFMDLQPIIFSILLLSQLTLLSPLTLLQQLPVD